MDSGTPRAAQDRSQVVLIVDLIDQDEEGVLSRIKHGIQSRRHRPLLKRICLRDDAIVDLSLRELVQLLAGQALQLHPIPAGQRQDLGELRIGLGRRVQRNPMDPPPLPAESLQHDIAPLELVHVPSGKAGTPLDGTRSMATM